MLLFSTLTRLPRDFGIRGGRNTLSVPSSDMFFYSSMAEVTHELMKVLHFLLDRTFIL